MITNALARKLPARLLLAVVAAAMIATPVLVLAGPADAGKRKHHKHHKHHKRHRSKTIKVIDFQFVPGKVKVRKGTTIVWKWSNQNTQNHDVKLVKGPRHVKKFKSRLAVSHFKFRQKLRKPGLYKYICTIHPSMRGQIRVTGGKHHRRHR